MFQFEAEKEKFALKPMNCPGHCVMFGSRARSWRELPLRFADFGVLHRNELSGTLTGLTRVRRFQQDDAHIFCMQSQVTSEVKSCLEFLKHIYGIFGFTFELKLSTRPEKFLGKVETWDIAEKQLENALNEFGQKWTLNPGDGAFYGPKIDITIQDALRRSHQCATIQLDFQLPERFNLQYMTSDEAGTKERPVIIHRAVLGSCERMIAILTESFGGKWPFWLSPRQAIVLTLSNRFDEYAHTVKDKLYAAGFECDFNSDQGTTLNKKVRNAQLDNYNFILVIGEKEQAQHTVNVRTRDNKVHGEVHVDDVIKRFKELEESKTNHAEEEFGVGIVATAVSDIKIDAE
jgi:threonyl-tRNA synthetase